MHPFIEAKLPEIKGLCRRYGVARLELFGSGARDDFDPGRSDVDLLVEFGISPAGMALTERHFGLLSELEACLGCRVDLIARRAIRNRRFLPAIQADLHCLHEAPGHNKLLTPDG
ncbi:MAG TPA: nucleotidyltransferase domain-containing protein [Geminicoccus sp.]|jgi:hypothetical protein|uniref:nucleotidyltransferase family protein n=1 Tax=Geminicoccus sp. TaxID=2024832 RepID=UPI002E35EB39|nr:nucleotidyltransferase domain-containing protein [Geminicoccus sp.]HEX2525334.1 nucleotidyltransferase domain-containing protein [Geminicoccus sp.]